MNPMDKDYVEQHDIQQRYLHGKLTPEEAEAFEVYLMENSHMIEEVQLDLVFKTSLPKVDSSLKSNGFIRSLFTTFNTNALAKMTAGVAVIGISYLTFMSLTVEKSLVTVIPSIEYVSTLRSDVFVANENFVRVEQSSRSLILVLQSDINTKDSFNIEITDSKGIKQAEVKGVFQNFQGDIVVAIDLLQLTPGNYEILLLPDAKEYQSPIIKQVITVTGDGI